MPFHALVADYDGTLAHEGRVASVTIDALARARAAGKRLILVTGRPRDKLLGDFRQRELFDAVVLENGAVFYRAGTGEERLLGEPPPTCFSRELIRRGVPVDRLGAGRVMVYTWRPHEEIVARTIRDLGLPHEVIFNKDAVMVLPPGIDKAAGLNVALEELNLTGEETIAVGDAENDAQLLRVCGLGVAVANATEGLRHQADLVTEAARGAGVVELIDRWLCGGLD